MFPVSSRPPEAFNFSITFAWRPLEDVIYSVAYTAKSNCETTMTDIAIEGRGESPVSETPTVSVIIPAYNTAAYIAETLDSVFSQTFTDFEVIVINDGSPDTDKLEKVIEPYLERIIYLKQENRGPSAA